MNKTRASKWKKLNSYYHHSQGTRHTSQKHQKYPSPYFYVQKWDSETFEKVKQVMERILMYLSIRCWSQEKYFRRLNSPLKFYHPPRLSAVNTLIFLLPLWEHPVQSLLCRTRQTLWNDLRSWSAPLLQSLEPLLQETELHCWNFPKHTAVLSWNEIPVQKSG